MSANLIPASKFTTALVLGKDEGRLRVDRTFLKRAGVATVLTAVSAAEAYDMLDRFAPQLIICDEALTDIGGIDFVRILKEDERYAGLPVIMTSVAPGRPAVLLAIAAGCAGFLIRPYSLAAFSKHLELAWRVAGFDLKRVEILRQSTLEAAETSVKADSLALAASGYDAVADVDDPADHFADGVKHLSAERYDLAISCFNKAIKLNNLHVEAYLGLSRAWANKGSLVQSRKYLTKAAWASLAGQRYAEFRDMFLETLKTDPSGFNPFGALGREHSRMRDNAMAEQAFVTAIELTPKDVSLHLELAQVYHAQQKSEDALAALQSAMALDPDDETAKRLRLVLAGRRDEEDAPAECVSKPAKPSLTMRIVNAVLYVAGSATEALHRMRRPDLSQAA